MIDDINKNDPQKVDAKGTPTPYRLLYSSWVSRWVTALDPNGPDELFILARGMFNLFAQVCNFKQSTYLQRCIETKVIIPKKENKSPHTTSPIPNVPLSVDLHLSADNACRFNSYGLYSLDAGHQDQRLISKITNA